MDDGSSDNASDSEDDNDNDNDSDGGGDALTPLSPYSTRRASFLVLHHA